MAQRTKQIDVYLEIGQKRTIAGTIDWPGWCRIGRDEGSALQALFDYAPRYAHAIHPSRLGFHAPSSASAFVVIERLAGNATTDFGAPDASPTSDAQPLSDVDLRRLQTLLRACWQAFDAAVSAAAGKELSKGPRGGGRDVEGIVAHVLGAEAGYLSRLGGKIPKGEAGDPSAIRQSIQDALELAAHGQVPERGPRGGKRWTPRYFVRREAWHVLDHAWEIEDRLLA